MDLLGHVVPFLVVRALVVLRLLFSSEKLD